MKAQLVQPTPGLIFLREAFLIRKKKNPNYSERAFARDIGISQTHLNLILNGKRSLSVRAISKIGARLKINDDQIENILISSLKSRIPGKNRNESSPHSIDLDQFRVISRWFHFAILDLTLTRGFKSDTSWIARTLEISKVEAQDAIDRLLRLGLLELKGSRLVKVHNHVLLRNEEADAAIQSHHLEMLEKAADCIRESSRESFARRDMNAFTIAANSRRIAEAKAKIDQFIASLTQFLSQGECDQLYQLNLHLFPLTRNPIQEKPPCSNRRK